MGYTTFTKKLILTATTKTTVQSILDLGSCNDYDIGGDKPPFISKWYESIGIRYACIDLAGDNGAMKLDLSGPIVTPQRWDLVVDAGTSEHVVVMKGHHSVAFHEGHINSIYPTEVEDIESGYYNCWLNKFNLCRMGGVIVSENPKTEHWKDHGYTYIDQSFYDLLSVMANLEIIELGEHGAMGNWETGVNIYSILKKTGSRFPSPKQFKNFPLKQS